MTHGLARLTFIRMHRITRAWPAVVTAVLALAVAAPASAYDTGPHDEITGDAMTWEGFRLDAVGWRR